MFRVPDPVSSLSLQLLPRGDAWLPPLSADMEVQVARLCETLCEDLGQFIK